MSFCRGIKEGDHILLVVLMEVALNSYILEKECTETKANSIRVTHRWKGRILHFIERLTRKKGHLKSNPIHKIGHWVIHFKLVMPNKKILPDSPLLWTNIIVMCWIKRVSERKRKTHLRVNGLLHSSQGKTLRRPRMRQCPLKYLLQQHQYTVLSIQNTQLANLFSFDNLCTIIVANSTILGCNWSCEFEIELQLMELAERLMT